MFLVCARFRAWPWAIIVAIVGTVIITTYLWDFQTNWAVARRPEAPGRTPVFFCYISWNPPWFNISAPGSASIDFIWRLCDIAGRLSFFSPELAHRSRLTNRLFPARCLLIFHRNGRPCDYSSLQVGAELGVQPVQFALHLRYYSFVSPLWAATLLLGFILHKQNIERVRRNGWIIMDAGALVVAICICGSAYFKGPSSDLLMLHA